MGGVTALVGVGVCARRFFKRALVLFLFPLLYYLLAGRGYAVFVRYMIPVAPFLCIGSALCAVWLDDFLKRRPGVLVVLLVVFLVLLVLLVLLVSDAAWYRPRCATRHNSCLIPSPNAEA